MTYTSQQLAQALQELAQAPETPSAEYGSRPLPDSLEESAEHQFPPAVADFLRQTGDYAEQTRAVNVGIY